MRPAIIEEGDSETNEMMMAPIANDDEWKCSSDDMKEIIMFVSEISDHVLNPDCNNNLDFVNFGNADWVQWEEDHSTQSTDDCKCKDLLTYYRKVHDDKLWTETVRTIFGMGNLLFENDGKEIDKYNKTLHILEKLVHSGNERDVNLCLKIKFGNFVVTRMLWSSEPPCIRTNVYSKIPLPEWLDKFYYSHTLKKISLLLGLVIETIGHYLDLVKDISILILFCRVTYPVWNSFTTFVEYLALALSFTIVFPEILKTSYFLSNYNFFINIQHQLNALGKCLVTFFMILFAPLLPSILFAERFKVNRALLSQEISLFNHMKNNLQMDGKKKHIKDNDLVELTNAFHEYTKLLGKRFKYLKVMHTSRHLEANTETFYQYLVHLIIIFISHTSIMYVSNSSRSDEEMAQQQLHRLFYNYPAGAFLLYFATIKAFISIIATRVSIEQELKSWFFPDMGKILFGFYTLVSLFVKIFSIVICFTPVLGLFGTSVHHQTSRIIFSEKAKKCYTNGKIDRWQSLTEGYQKHSIYNNNTLFIYYFLVFVPATSVMLYLLKSRCFDAFHGGGVWQIPRKLMHIANCVVFPSISQDWDQDISPFSQGVR